MRGLPLQVRSPFVRKREASRALSMTLDFDEWLSYFNFNGIGYPYGLQQTAPGQKEQPVSEDYVGIALAAYQACGPIFACELLRMMVFSEARLQWQQMNNGRPGDLFGTQDLAILEEPWTNGTTGDLLARAELDSACAGNFFAVRRGQQIRRLRPDWMLIVLGVPNDTMAPPTDVDAEVLGYIYQPGFPATTDDAVVFMANEVAHYYPIPDPIEPYKGMSWMRPVVREVMADKAATKHKLNFFERGATPNMVVKLNISDMDAFDKWVAKFQETHEGAANAYKTLFLTMGADVEVVGKDFQQLEFKVTQAAGETRIAAAAGTPSVLVGLSEGLASATYNNYPAARRQFADTTLRPRWRNFAGSIQKLVPPSPAGRPDPRAQGARLWYDDRDIPFLRDDTQAAGELLQYRSSAVRQLIDGGFKPDAVIKAVLNGDLNLLIGQHTGLFSVQLQKPGGDKLQADQSPNGATPDPAKAIAALEAGTKGDA